MKKDLISVIRETSKFLGYHMTELQILRLDDHLYIDNFRKLAIETFSEYPQDPSGENPMVKFFRKGVVGDWKNYFHGEKLKIWDQWIVENLRGIDITNELSYRLLHAGK